MDICKDISVVIQGPLDERTYEAIDAYQYFNEVIVSTWDTDDLSLLEPASGKYKVVTSSYPENISSYFNEGSRYFMSQTTLTGALAASGKYVMKTRSDELYPDLSEMLNNLKEYPERVHTTDNGFWTNIKAAFSNHLFIEQTKYLIKAMKFHNIYCANIDPKLSFEINQNFRYAEQTFGYFIMLGRGFDILDSDVAEVYRKNIFVTPCSKLKDHLHSGQTTYKSRGFKRSTKPYPEGRPDVHSGKHDIRYLLQHIDDLEYK